MDRLIRLFEIVQILRRARRPMTAAHIAERLQVSPRTIYRDVAALQNMAVPIDGEAGLGYLLRPGFDLPPLAFSATELEAIQVGMALLPRTGDAGLARAAEGVIDKIRNAIPPEDANWIDAGGLRASGWHEQPQSGPDMAMLRSAIRDARKLDIRYLDSAGAATTRVILPLVLIYYVEVTVIAAWCELRTDYRHVRTDRIAQVQPLDHYFIREANSHRVRWQEQNLPPPPGELSN